MSWIKTIYKESVVLASKRSKQMQFAGLIFLVLALLFYKWHGFTTPFYTRIGSSGVMVFGLVLLPQLIYPVLLFWFLIGKFVGEIVSFILISLLYFLFIWIAKLFVKVDLESGWKLKNSGNDYKSMG